ncbi:MAG: tyrosine-type recombinase/integrase [Parcubacteria group bacterium]|jgi:site-specific recombinase XerD
MRYINEFATYLKVDKELSPHSSTAYIRDLNEFQEFSKVTTEGKITRTHIREFLSFISDKNQPITRRRKLTSIRMFFKFLEDEKLIKENPTKGLPSPKVEIKEPSWLTENETKKLVQAVEKSGSLRDEVIIRILVETGMRLNELANLNIGDLDTKNKTIKIHRKGNKEQTIPINIKLNLLINKFIKNIDSDKPLITSSFGRRMTNRRIGLLVKSYLKRAGIQKNVSCHSLRHSFCTRMLEKGADIKTIQILAGHVTIATTEKYLHIANPKLRKEVVLAEVC